MNKEKLHQYIFIIGLIICTIVFIYVRMPMLSFENSIKAWNSDNAIFAMMGEDIKTFSDFPFYYWGGNYLGPFNNIAMAFTQSIFDLFQINHPVPLKDNVNFIISPLAVTITCMTLFFIGNIFWALSFKKMFSSLEAVVSVFMLSIGSSLLMRTTLRPLAPEVTYLLGAMIFWSGHKLIHLNNYKNQILFGFIVGLSWWMNQVTIFAIVPILFYFVSQDQNYKRLRLSPQIFKRLLLCENAIGISKINKPLKIFIGLIYSLSTINFIMGLMIVFIGGVNTTIGPMKLKIHNGASPMKTSVLIFVVSQLLLWFFKNENAKSFCKGLWEKIKGFLIGIAIGYGPVIFGKVFQFIESGYTPKLKFVPPQYIPSYWAKLIHDFFPSLLGLNKTPFIAPLTLILLCTIIFSIIKNKNLIHKYLLLKPEKYPRNSILWGIVLFNLIYILISERSRNQYAFRYAILSLPVISIYFVTLHRRIKMRAIGLTISVIACFVFTIAQYRQGQLQINEYLNGTSHKEQLATIYKSNCDVILTDYWNAYVLEYFSARKRKFLVGTGLDRTPAKTKKLMNDSKLQKCRFDSKTLQINKI